MKKKVLNKISLCVLVHKQTIQLEEFLKKTKKLFDETIAVIDTKNKETLSILKKHKIPFYFRKLDDFSSQMNYIDAKAKHSWVFSLAVDEEIWHKKKFQRWVEKFRTKKLDNNSIYVFPRKNNVQPNYYSAIRADYPRFKQCLYNKKYAEWYGAIHEYLIPKNKKARLKKEVVPIQLRHNHTQSNISLAEKNILYARLMNILRQDKKYFAQKKNPLKEILLYLHAFYIKLHYLFKPWSWGYPIYWLFSKKIRIDKKIKTNTTIIYIANIRLPSPRANSIQIINTCYALAQQGIPARLIVRNMSRHSTKEILANYGLSHSLNIPLSIHKMPLTNWGVNFVNNLFFHIFSFIKTLIILLKQENCIVLTRELSKVTLLKKFKNIFRIKILYEAHDFKKQKQIVRYFKKKYIDAIITISDYLNKSYKKFIGNSSASIFTIRDAAKELRPSSGKKSNTIIYVGHLYPWKDVDCLVRSMQYVHKPYSLKIIGGIENDADFKRIQTLIQTLNLNKRVSLLGHIPYFKAQKELQKAAIGVVTLDKNNPVAKFCTSPMKLFEYMAQKLCIIAPNLPSIREIIKHKKNGLLYTAGNEKSLAAQINLITENKVIRKNIIAASSSDFENYTWDNRAKKIIASI